jgi:hypothetical protein
MSETGSFSQRIVEKLSSGGAVTDPKGNLACRMERDGFG